MPCIEILVVESMGAANHQHLAPLGQIIVVIHGV